MNPILKVECAFFVITWKDGTPLSATSVTKEDIIKMCIKMGHTHPLGVLCYSMMELVALFCSTEEMQHATHGVIEGMELWGEVIAVRAVAPLETHVKAYIIAVGGYSSKLHSPPSEEEGEPYSPHDNHHLSGETPQHLQVELGNLADHELHQLVGDDCQEITLYELNAPSRSPPLTPWGHPSGSRNTKEGNEEVTFLRGGGCFPQDNHPHLLPLCDQIEDRFLRDCLHHPNFLLNQIQTWGA